MNAQESWYSDESATFGDRLAAAREAAGMSQKQLARRVGVKQATVRNWEEDLAEPRANRLTMLCGLLGVSLSWLLTGEGEGVDPPGEPEDLADDLPAILAEMRAVRVEARRLSERLGLIEKRLKAFGGADT